MDKLGAGNIIGTRRGGGKGNLREARSRASARTTERLTRIMERFLYEAAGFRASQHLRDPAWVSGTVGPCRRASTLSPSKARRHDPGSSESWRTLWPGWRPGSAPAADCDAHCAPLFVPTPDHRRRVGDPSRYPNATAATGTAARAGLRLLRLGSLSRGGLLSSGWRR